MTEKELKKLNRRQLLELLILQTERADRLQEKLDALQLQLEAKITGLSEAGSIAEASLKLSGVFEAAQSAAEGYLENIRCLEDAAKEKAQTILEEAERKCREREQAADSYWAEKEERIRKQCELLEEIFGKEPDEL